MKKRYIFLAIVPILLSLLLALLPDNSHSLDQRRKDKKLKSAIYTGITPDKVLLESVKKDRFISSDELAKVVLAQDPTYLLIDLRDSAQYNKFTLPGALNIPVESVLEESNLAIFRSPAYISVLFSNGTVKADQVWITLRRIGAKNVKVLDGGINQFYKIYMDPPKPIESDPEEAFENYSFRKAVGKYLGLPNPQEFIPEGTPSSYSNASMSTPVKKAAPKVIVPVKKAKVEDEGC